MNDMLELSLKNKTLRPNRIPEATLIYSSPIVFLAISSLNFGGIIVPSIVSVSILVAGLLARRNRIRKEEA